MVDEALKVVHLTPIEPAPQVKAHTFAQGEDVIAMTEFKGRLIIATTNDIYEVRDKRLVRLCIDRFDEDA